VGHTVAEWYRNAKLGIMVHWGLPSIPAFAPPGGSFTEILAEHDWPWYFLNNPYAEWYQNSLRIPGSPARSYHVRRFNRTFPYQRLAERFNADLPGWDPGAWADLFRESGARYVVMVAKHHDGFLMWPSEHQPPVEGYVAARDVVGELAEAVRERGLRFGTYYSGLLDWTVQTEPIRDFPDLLCPPSGDEYAAYAEAHFRELIDRYSPDLLWNDIGLPGEISRRGLFHYYREKVPGGVLNDRWQQVPPFVKRLLARPWLRRRLSEAARKRLAAAEPAGKLGDVPTTEYPRRTRLRDAPWEAVRSIGNSFCYNAQEEDTYLGGNELIWMLADVVSKNGNLLLNVGPKSDGTIPAEQRLPLQELATWISTNGPAIYGTRPWVRAEGTTSAGASVRFTTRKDTLFAIVRERPAALSLTLPDLDPRTLPGVSAAGDAGGHLAASILGLQEAIEFRASEGGVEVFLPGSLVVTGPFVIAFRWVADQSGPEPIQLYTDVI
jgi:alpha-L-fucosidase